MKSSTFETILPHYYCFSEENTFNSVTYLGGGGGDDTSVQVLQDPDKTMCGIVCRINL